MKTLGTLKILTALGLSLLLCSPSFSGNTPFKEMNMMEKVTFRVDTRSITVSTEGMFVAGEFSSTIGIPNWTPIPMCDLGSGIWEVSFANIPLGTYQFKFLNGPTGWEFNGFGGPCTNPLDNNNRWMNYPGGMHLEGSHCYSTCDMWCPGFSDPGVSDTDPPVILEPAPANVTLNCGDPLPPAVALMADDECDENATTMTELPVDDLSGLNACGVGDIIRTWTVTDCSGNSTSVSQTISLVDTEPPYSNDPIPPDTIYVDCGASVPAAFQLAVTDDCDASIFGTSVVTDWVNLTPGCTSGLMIREWEATDCSGNEFFTDQNIVRFDNLPPTITGGAPADITVECQNLPPSEPLDASDNCTSSLTSTDPPTDDLSGLGPCGTGTIIRTWEATDCAGLTTTVSQTITLEDSTPPIIIAGAPADVTVSCGNLPAANTLTATDACDQNVNATGMPTDDVSGIGPCGTGTIIRTWEVSDCAGNMTSVSQTITVEDMSPPSITGAVPADITLTCSEPLPNALPLSANDDCDPSVNSTGAPTDDLSGITPCGVGTILRTWEVTDCAGNTASVSQTITVADNTPPVITNSFPTIINVECSGLPSPDPLSANDDCDMGVISTNPPMDDLSGLNNCGLGTIIRTWAVSDCSGNLASTSQTIIIEDTEPPMVPNPPSDITVSCGNLPAVNALPASDACDGNVSSTHTPTDDISGLSPCGIGVIVRSWSATDCQGNFTIVTQNITVEDAGAPTIDEPIPADVTVNCGDLPTAFALDASDDCDASVTTTGLPVDDVSGLTACGTGNIIRTWTVTDCSGNDFSASQTITVEDNAPPVFLNPPQDLNVCVGNVPPMEDLTWEDDCAGTGMVSGTETSDGMTNPETLTRTWTYMDACGNEVTHTQTIVVAESGMANVGPDLEVCDGETVTLTASGAGGATSVLWETSGDGVFSNPNDENTEYSPGSDDLTNGSVTLTFTPTSTGNCTIEPDELTLSFLVSPSANAGMNQTINCLANEVTLDGSGSTGGSLEYQWSGPGINPGNENEVNPIVDEPGIYTLTVNISGETCTSTATVEVLENTDLPTANAGDDQALTCVSPSVELNGSGMGTGTIEYLWTGPGINASNQNTPDPTVSESGIYTLTVTDPSSGCTATDEAEVTVDGDVPTADAGDDQIIDCLNDTANLDGSNSSTGADIEYQWFAPDGSPLGTSLGQSVSEGGIFTLTVSNTSNGCEISSEVSVSVDTISPPANAGTGGTLTCLLNNIEIGEMGNASLEYTWSGPGINASNENLPNPTVSQMGIYSVEVTDPTNGCSATDEVEIFENTTPPSADAGMDAAIDCASPSVPLDGTGSSSASGDLEYLWSGPGIDASNENLAEPTISQSGIYTLTITDPTNGCTDEDEVEVTTDGDLPTALAGADFDLTCLLTQATLDATGSTSGTGIEYEWTDGGGTVLGSDLTLEISGPGTYVFTVSNTLNGCSANDALTVGIDTISPAANAGTDMMIDCSTSSVTLIGSGSTSASGSIEYLWSGPGIDASNENLAEPNISQSGIYTLTATDPQNGCTDVDEVEVVQDGSLPSADAGPDQTLTCTTLNVTLTGNGSGGSQFTYLWTGPGIDATNETDQNPNVNEPGIYSLVVIDGNTGCSSSVSTVEVLENTDAPSISISPPNTLGCQTLSTVLDASASMGAGTLDFLWTGPGINSGNQNEVAPTISEPGFYELTLTDLSNGCTATETVQVIENGDLPTVMIAGNNLLTCELEVIELSETASAGQPEMAFAWSTTDGNFAQADLSQPTVLLDAPGTYSLTVTNTITGCSNEEFFIANEDIEAPQISFDQTFELGCNSSNIELSANVVATSNDLIYEWVGPSFSSSELNPTISQSGTYTLNVTNEDNGCSSMENTDVTQISGIESALVSTQQLGCDGSSSGSIAVESVTGSPPFQYAINGGPFGDSPLFENLNAGIFTLTIVDANGCQWEDEFVLSEGQNITVNLGDNMEIDLGETVTLTPSISSSPAFWEWSNPATLDCPECLETTAQPTETTTYQLTVTADGGCSGSDAITIYVNDRVKIFAPNVFSPNGDGINDQFTIFAGSQVARIDQLLVYDRWGGNVFEAFDFEPNQPILGWDGTHRGEIMGNGVYVFFAEISLVNGEKEFIEGEVILAK